MTDGSWGYPNGTLPERAAIWRRHVEFTRGLLWFWASDPGVPAAVRQVGVGAALLLALGDPPRQNSCRCAGRPARSRWCKSTAMKE